MRSPRLTQPPGKLTPLRLASSLLLAALLLSTRWYEDTLYTWLDAGWHHLGWVLPAATHPAEANVQHLMERPHSLPAALLFAASYVGLSLALLAALVPSGEGWRWGLRLYSGLGLASLLLLLASHLAGLPVLAALASRLLHALLSPLPVMVLVPLLWWPGAPATR